MEPKDRLEFAKLKKSNLKTARAWALKETAMAIYGYVYARPARKHFRWRHRWAMRSPSKPMIEVARASNQPGRRRTSGTLADFTLLIPGRIASIRVLTS